MVGHMSKYAPLSEFLNNNHGDKVELTLKQIEIILRERLPPSARMYPAWWHDPASHPHVKSWTDTGWDVSTCTNRGQIERVVFSRAKFQTTKGGRKRS